MPTRFHRVIWAEPWTAKGPGWSNDGISGEIEYADEGGIHTEKVTIYFKDMTPEEIAAWRASVAVIDILKGAIEREGRSLLVERDEDDWPPIKPGTHVQISDAPGDEEWRSESQVFRTRWGESGMVVGHHDSHGLYYDVKLSDGWIMPCDPEELTVIKKK